MDVVRVLLVLLFATTTVGCAAMTPQQQRILSGSAIGTAAGVVDDSVI